MIRWNLVEFLVGLDDPPVVPKGVDERRHLLTAHGFQRCLGVVKLLQPFRGVMVDMVSPPRGASRASCGGTPRYLTRSLSCGGHCPAAPIPSTSSRHNYVRGVQRWDSPYACTVLTSDRRYLRVLAVLPRPDVRRGPLRRRTDTRRRSRPKSMWPWEEPKTFNTNSARPPRWTGADLAIALVGLDHTSERVPPHCSIGPDRHFQGCVIDYCALAS